MEISKQSYMFRRGEGEMEGGSQTDSCPTPVSGCHLAEADASVALEMPMLVNVTESLNC